MTDVLEEHVEQSPPFRYCVLDCVWPIVGKTGTVKIKEYRFFSCICSCAINIKQLEVRLYLSMVCAVLLL